MFEGRLVFSSPDAFHLLDILVVCHFVRRKDVWHSWYFIFEEKNS